MRQAQQRWLISVIISAEALWSALSRLSPTSPLCCTISIPSRKKGKLSPLTFPLAPHPKRINNFLHKHRQESFAKFQHHHRTLCQESMTNSNSVSSQEPTFWGFGQEKKCHCSHSALFWMQLLQVN